MLLIVLEVVGAGLWLYHMGLPKIEQVHPRLKLHPAGTNARPLLPQKMLPSGFGP